MRKTHEQVKAELLARRDRYLAQRRRRRKAAVALVASAVCLVAVLAVALPHLPFDGLRVGAPSEDKGNSTVTSTAPTESLRQTHATHIYDGTLNGVPDETHPSVQEEPVTYPDAGEPTNPAMTTASTAKSAAVPHFSAGTRPGTNQTTTAVVTTACTTVRFTQAPHGSDRPYRGAVADFVPVSVRLPYEGDAAQELTAEATALWEFGLQLTEKPRKTEVNFDDMIGARYAVFRDADGYELTCLYGDTCVGLGNDWYDITAQEAETVHTLLESIA